jgi:hypothetical protein
VSVVDGKTDHDHRRIGLREERVYVLSMPLSVLVHDAHRRA